MTTHRNIYIVGHNCSKSKDPFRRCYDYTCLTRTLGDKELGRLSAGRFFYRKSDAKEWISWQTNPEFYEVLTVPFAV
jgi:hypothetical protein